MRQALHEGLLDGLIVHLVPVLPGGRVRLVDRVEADLRCTRVAQTRQASRTWLTTQSGDSSDTTTQRKSAAPTTPSQSPGHLAPPNPQNGQSVRGSRQRVRRWSERKIGDLVPCDRVRGDSQITLRYDCLWAQPRLAPAGTRCSAHRGSGVRAHRAPADWGVMNGKAPDLHMLNVIVADIRQP